MYYLCTVDVFDSGASCSGRSSLRSSRHHDVCPGLQSTDRRREYIKKPLNAFMLFMKEKRQRVIEECTLKESAAINQILGRKVVVAIDMCNSVTQVLLLFIVLLLLLSLSLFALVSDSQLFGYSAASVK